jgi:TM2 domain-containing membrane protein YozV
MAKIKRNKKPAKKNKNQVREVKWTVCLVMSVLFGSLGVDRFMMGKVGTGILKLVTCGGLWIWWLVDVILIAEKRQYKNVKWVN